MAADLLDGAEVVRHNCTSRQRKRVRRDGPAAPAHEPAAAALV